MKIRAKEREEKVNLTLKLDRDLLREVRVLAAEEDTSISALVSTQIRELVKKRRGYEQARKRALTRLHKGYDLGFTPAKSRDELYER